MNDFDNPAEGWDVEDIEDSEPLPVTSEAELGELSKDEVASYYDNVAPSVEAVPEGDWEGMAAVEELGWGYETPVGTVPMGPMQFDEVLDFIEGLEKPWPKDDPRRAGFEGGES